MEITFNLPSVFEPDSSSLADAYVLRALLDVLLMANRVYLRDHAVPNLYRSGVVYGRTKVWESIPALYLRGYGDCKSLAMARIAELERDGIQAVPNFRWVRRKDGFKDFHILVQTANGYEDPSRRLGMGADEVAKFKG